MNHDGDDRGRQEIAKRVERDHVDDHERGERQDPAQERMETGRVCAPFGLFRRSWSGPLLWAEEEQQARAGEHDQQSSRQE